MQYSSDAEKRGLPRFRPGCFYSKYITGDDITGKWGENCVAKNPAFQLYTGDWLKDPNLSMCAPGTRGIWMDLICAMHENDRSGEVTGTVAGLARLCRCSPQEMVDSLEELKNTKTARVTERHKNITIVNRRMEREAKERINNKIRQARHRQKDVNGSVTKKSRSHSSKDTKDTKDTRSKPLSRSTKFSDVDLAISSEFFEALKSRNPRHKKPNLESWANDVRLMRERDGRQPDQIREMFEWAQADSFWSANILSPKKLREKFDQLTIKRQNGNGTHQQDTRSSAKRVYDELSRIAAAADEPEVDSGAVCEVSGSVAAQVDKGHRGH